MPINIDLSGLFDSEDRAYRRQLENQRLQQQIMLAHADQVLQENAAKRAEQERQATLADAETKAFNARVAEGMPAEDAIKITKAVYRAHGLDASPSVKPVDPNKGGGYEYSGFFPGQQESFSHDPVKERQRLAANQAAAIAATQGHDIEAQGLMPRMEQRVLQSPGGQQAMGDFGEQAGLAAGSGMASPIHPMAIGGLGAIAGIPAQPERQNLAPSDGITAVAQQAAMMGDAQTLAYLRAIAQQRSLYGQKNMVEETRQGGMTKRGAAKNEAMLEAAEIRAETARRLAELRARLSGGGGKVDARDLQFLTIQGAQIRNDASDFAAQKRELDTQLSIASRRDIFGKEADPEQAKIIRAKMDAVEQSRKDSMAPLIDNYNQVNDMVAKRRGLKTSPRGGKVPPPAVPVPGVTAAAPAGAPATITPADVAAEIARRKAAKK